MNIENMTDEDLMNMESPPPVAAPDPVPSNEPELAPANEGGDDDQNQDDNQPTPNEGEDGDDDAGSKDGGEANADGAEGDGKEGQKPTDENLSDDDFDKQSAPVEKKQDAPAEDKNKKPTKGEQQPPKKEAKQEEKKPEQPAEAPDYKAAYEKLIGVPIKADGKEIVLNTPEEVLKLVQQGASYHRRMNELKPARKATAMLEAAGLLGNEAAIGQMIDLFQGKPEAIAKTIKDNNIDVLALDMESGANYTPKGHLLSDEAVNFNDTLKELRTLPGGMEAMTLIDTWDQPSQDALWGNATALRQIYDYKQNGIYDVVASEVERRKLLGEIPAGEPFIVSFERVGGDLAAKAAAEAQSNAVRQPTTPPSAPAKPEERKPVASGPAPRKSEAPNAQAAAAAAPRAGVGAAKQTPDIFSLSDDDIAKMQSPNG